jgi:YjbE family integral membrane protein
MEHGSLSAVLTPVLQICLIDLLLAGDNAVVIALACRGLPPRLWRQAVWVGTAAALVLRIALTAAAALILNVPFLKLVGAALLLVIAVQLVVEERHDDLDTAARQQDLWKAVATILVADTVMSLDNVLAVAAASRGSLWLLALGLALSVPILIFGSVAVARMLQRFPILIPAGGALLGWVAGDTAVSDPAIAPWIDREAWLLSQLAAPIGAAYVLIHGRLGRRWRSRRSAAGG